MTWEAILAVACSVAAIALLVSVLRGAFWIHIGAWFVVAAVLFHGVSEIVNAAAASRNRYRMPGDDRIIADWLIWIGPSLLVCTVAYLAVLGQNASIHPRDDRRGLVRVSSFYSWRTCIVIVIPLYMLSLQGTAPSREGVVDVSYFQAGFADQFLLLAITITGFALCVRFGHFILIAVGQSALLLLLGQRLAVLGGLAGLAYLLARAGRTPNRKAIAAFVGIGVISALGLSAARLTAGRFEEGSAAVSRLVTVMSGFSALYTGEARAALADDYIYRIDGNIYPAMILAAQAEGASPIGLTSVKNAVLLAVPSFIVPQKTEKPLEERSEKVFLAYRYGFSTKIDYLPTLLGASVSYGGGPFVLVVALVVGCMFALMDRWLKRNTPARLVIGLALLNCAVYYERGFEVYPITLRGALAVVALVWITESAVRIVKISASAASARGVDTGVRERGEEPRRYIKIDGPSRNRVIGSDSN